LLEEITKFAPDDPYRINLTIAARHYLEATQNAKSEEQLIRTLRPHYADETVEGLVQKGLAELNALEERLVSRAVDN
jgi:hypothetical protein